VQGNTIGYLEGVSWSFSCKNGSARAIPKAYLLYWGKKGIAVSFEKESSHVDHKSVVNAPAIDDRIEFSAPENAAAELLRQAWSKRLRVNIGYSHQATTQYGIVNDIRIDDVVCEKTPGHDARELAEFACN